MSEEIPKKPKGKAGNPGRVCTRELGDERTEYVSRLIVKQLYPSEIKKGFRQKYGQMSSRNIENYISRAIKLLKKQAAMSPNEAKDLAITSLLDVIRTGKPSERTGALRLWTEIFGFAAADKIILQNPDGTSLAPIGIHITGGILPQRNGDKNKTGG